MGGESSLKSDVESCCRYALEGNCGGSSCFPCLLSQRAELIGLPYAVSEVQSGLGVRLQFQYSGSRRQKQAVL